MKWKLSDFLLRFVSFAWYVLSLNISFTAAHKNHKRLSSQCMTLGTIKLSPSPARVSINIWSMIYRKTRKFLTLSFRVLDDLDFNGTSLKSPQTCTFLSIYRHVRGLLILLNIYCGIYKDILMY